MGDVADNAHPRDDLSEDGVACVKGTLGPRIIPQDDIELRRTRVRQGRSVSLSRHPEVNSVVVKLPAPLERDCLLGPSLTPGTTSTVQSIPRVGIPRLNDEPPNNPVPNQVAVEAVLREVDEIGDGLRSARWV